MAQVEEIVAIAKKLLPTTWLKWLDGYKSKLGLLGVGICLIVDLLMKHNIIHLQIPPNLAADGIKLFGLLFGYGMLDKAQKLKADISQLTEEPTPADLAGEVVDEVLEEAPEKENLRGITNQVIIKPPKP